MDISQIQNQYFTEDTEPRDEHLIDLLEQAYRGEILCRLALADIGVVKPYSNYKPETREHYRHNFMKRLRSGEPTPLHVYASGNNLIMSDDYNSYWLYRELGEKKYCV